MKFFRCGIMVVVTMLPALASADGPESTAISHQFSTPSSVFNSQPQDANLQDEETEETSGIAPVSFDQAYTPQCDTCPPTCCDTGCCDTGGCCDCGKGDSCGCVDDWNLSCLKKQPLCGDWKWTAGLELRYRYMNEINRLRPAGETQRSTYDLWRIAPFVQVGNDWVTGYVQAIDAPIFNEDLGKLPIDEDRADLLQYYVDAKLYQGDGSLRARYGRQFLKYGSQHLISPLAWSNTYRTFEGGKLYYDSPNISIDAFVVNPANGAASPQVFFPTSANRPDESLVFSGVYATLKNAPNGTLDIYWLYYDEDEPRNNRQDGQRHTVGARYAGQIVEKECCKPVRTWMWDLEGAYQWGEDRYQNGGNGLDVSAGFVSAVSGVTFNSVTWSPSIKGVFWWGSGDDDPTDGETNSVNTLFPLGHAYWGQIDNFNGSNLIDYSIQGSVQPAKKLNLAAHWHWFDKASTDDNVYNIANAPLGNVTTGERRLGTELDLLATYKVNNNWTMQVGYFWFWYGDAVDNNAGIPSRGNAEQVYVQSMMTF